jgi:hypothetical protein
VTKTEAIDLCMRALPPELQTAPMRRAMELAYEAGHIEGTFDGSVKAIKHGHETMKATLDEVFANLKKVSA